MAEKPHGLNQYGIGDVVKLRTRANAPCGLRHGREYRVRGVAVGADNRALIQLDNVGVWFKASHFWAPKRSTHPEEDCYGSARADGYGEGLEEPAHYGVTEVVKDKDGVWRPRPDAYVGLAETRDNAQVRASVAAEADQEGRSFGVLKLIDVFAPRSAVRRVNLRDVDHG